MSKKLLPGIPLLLSIALALARWRWPALSDTGEVVLEVFFWLSVAALVIVSLVVFWGKVTALLPIKIRIEKKPKARSPESPSRVSESEQLCEQQKGHEEQWLRPVVEWIDFNRPRLSPRKIILKYQIDSGLVYSFTPYRMWLKLRIGTYEPKEGWEIVPARNLPKCKRSQWASEEFTVHDDDLLKIIEGCRQGLQIAQTLKLIVQFREGDGLKELEGSYSVNPYSEFPQES